MKHWEKRSTDVLIIGSGGAGMRAAIAAADAGASVLLLSKGRAGVSGATVTAVADVSVDSRSAADLLGLPGDRRDSPELFFEDILQGGGGLSDPKLVRRFVQEVPQRLQELIEWGAKVRGFSVSPGHRYPRAVIINGRNFASVLLQQVRARPAVQILDQAAALDLCVQDGRVCGAWALDMGSGRYVSIAAKSVVLATGGAMNLFPTTTAPSDLLGDGISMGARAGVPLRDMEFQTFLLGCAAPEALRGNNYPYVLVCRCGGQLLNREGERFMKKTDPVLMEKTTRDKLAVAVSKEILEGRGGPNQGVWVSIRHIPRNVFAYYRQWYESSLGFQTFDPKNFLPDLMENAIEAVPSAHFWCGGLVIDEDGRTELPGLYAAGECTGGLHGANRLSGNAMAETITMGQIAGDQAARLARELPPAQTPMEDYFRPAEALLERSGEEDPIALRKQLQTAAWKTTGPIRSGEGLKEMLKTVDQVRRRLPEVGLRCRNRVFNREWLEALSLSNLCDGLEAVALSALTREESRGSHYRTDCPQPVEPLYAVYVRRQDGKQTTERRAVGGDCCG